MWNLRLNDQFLFYGRNIVAGGPIFGRILQQKIALAGFESLPLDSAILIVVVANQIEVIASYVDR